jgi:uncharacterized membrane protein
MHSIKQRLARWFNNNFEVIREDESGREIQSKSYLGCFLLLLLFLPLVLISFGFTIFLIFKIYPIIFSTLITRLGIASWLGLPLLIATFFGCFINLPLFILTARRQEEQRQNFEILPLFLLKVWCLPSYKTRYQTYGYIALNVSGGLIPIILALYQFHRVPPSAILYVTAIVSLLSYFLVTVIPGRAIVSGLPGFWLITTVAALSAMVFVAGGVNRFDVSVAFAGGVLGITIGSDLLHLKDVHPELAETPLSPLLSLSDFSY